MTGIVKWFDPVKGYGFIVVREGAPDVFVHYKHIEGSGYKSLDRGDRVSFDIGEVDEFGRLGAINVVKVCGWDAGLLCDNGEL